MKPFAALWTAALLFAPALQAETLTYVDLIHRLTDLERLVALPAAGEKCAQWSSYDRRSRYEAETGKYVDWSANGDGAGIIRKEGDQLVLAEMEGPGCIWRIWSAKPEQGHVRIFLDGAETPAVDLPFIGYFDRKNEPFTRPALVHTVARGWNNYVPIPYQRSCKITADSGWGRYYHFTYTTYPPGTVLPTFKRALTADEAQALDEANRLLSQCGPDTPPPPANATTDKVTILATPGSTQRVVQLTGPQAITTIKARLEPPAGKDDRELLRELTLQIRWDGEEHPAVWAPFGDFFGTAAGANPYRSFPSGLTEEGVWYSHWRMPFATSAVIEVGNDGAQTRTLHFEVTHAPLTRPIGELGRFHAKWHRDAFLPAEPERAIDWTMLKTSGRGRFVGVMLNVWNPRGGWWGEGDEKFFVDGEKFPSTFGTGSEDYFGYAWCCPELFENCYHNQTISQGNKGHVCVNRWHIADNVPFQTSFEACIEKYKPNKLPEHHAAISYWYLAPGGEDSYTALPLEERVGYWVMPEVPRVKGALEGERLRIAGKTAGNPREQGLSHYQGEWSGQSHLWWTGAEPGDKLILLIPVKQPGRYAVTLQLTKARDYGIVQLYLDDEKLGEAIDLYNPAVVPTGALDMGVHELTAGDHRLTVDIVGANEKALKRYMFGLDYVLLIPAKE